MILAAIINGGVGSSFFFVTICVWLGLPWLLVYGVSTLSAGVEGCVSGVAAGLDGVVELPDDPPEGALEVPGLAVVDLGADELELPEGCVVEVDD
jgi:hypothetical protein